MGPFAFASLGPEDLVTAPGSGRAAAAVLLGSVGVVGDIGRAGVERGHLGVHQGGLRLLLLHGRAGGVLAVHDVCVLLVCYLVCFWPARAGYITHHVVYIILLTTSATVKVDN